MASTLQTLLLPLIVAGRGHVLAKMSKLHRSGQTSIGAVFSGFYPPGKALAIGQPMGPQAIGSYRRDGTHAENIAGRTPKLAMSSNS